MDNRVETKARYFEWHGKDLTTWGEISGVVAGCEAVLDLGGGTGWLARRIHGAGVPSVVATDIDTVVLDLNDGSDSGVTGVVASAESLPFEDGSFDAIIAKDIIEHLLFPAEAIRECARVLRPGGKIYIATPSDKSKTFFNDYTHIRPFNETSLRALLEDQGLQVNTIYYSGSFPGVGRWMRVRGTEKMPNWVYTLARLGINRGNIHAVATTKEHVTSRPTDK